MAAEIKKKIRIQQKQVARETSPPPDRWMHRGLTPAMKAAMRLIGLPVGDPCPLYAPLDAWEVTALADFLNTKVLAERMMHAQG